MSMGTQFWRSTPLVLAIAVTACSSFALAAGPGKKALHGKSPQKAPQVELFDAMENGQLAVKFIPTNAKQGQLLIKNNTKQPLNVRLPEAFAGLPVLAQFLPLPGPQNPIVNADPFANPIAAPPQPLGNILQPGGGFPGNGLFNIPPEKVIRLRVKSVCLEYGKPDPNPKIAYEIKRLESFNNDPKLKKLMIAYRQGRYNYHVIQAVAWHICNDMSWDKLAKIRHGSTQTLFFKRQHMIHAKQLFEELSGPAVPYRTVSTINRATVGK